MQFYLLFALTIYLFSKLVTKKNLINYLLTLILFSFFFSIFVIINITILIFLIYYQDFMSFC